MAAHFSLIFLGLSALLVCCSTGAIADRSGTTAKPRTVEEQLQQLNENYMEMKELLEAKNRRLVALEALEVEVMEQKSVIAALQQSVSGTQVAAANRQGTSTVPRSCADLKCKGETISGLYSIMGAKSVEMVYCDFSKATYEAGFQKWVGYVDVKSVPTYFYVQKNNTYSTQSGPIPFELEVVNIGGAMNLASGVFTAPRPGTYFFAFTGEIRFTGPIPSVVAAVVGLQLNGIKVGSSHATDSNTSTSTYSQLALQSILNLKAGDQVSVIIDFLNNAIVYDNPYQHFNHFTGMLLEENLAGLI